MSESNANHDGPCSSSLRPAHRAVSAQRSVEERNTGDFSMRDIFNRREFLQAGAVVGASFAMPSGMFAAGQKSVLVFTKSAAVLFFTTGDLTTVGTDKNPPMSAQGKQSLLDAIHGGLGSVGIHAASDTFHTQPDPEDHSNRYTAHGEQSDPYLRMLGGEFITHVSTPRLQNASIIINDPKFPGLEGVASPVTLNVEWYSL